MQRLRWPSHITGHTQCITQWQVLQAASVGYFPNRRSFIYSSISPFSHHWLCGGHCAKLQDSRVDSDSVPAAREWQSSRETDSWTKTANTSCQELGQRSVSLGARGTQRRARSIKEDFLEEERISSVQFSHSVVSDSLQPQGLQHARSPCPSPTPEVYSNSCPLSWWQPSNHLILFHPVLLPPSIVPSIRVFSNNSALVIR